MELRDKLPKHVAMTPGYTTMPLGGYPSLGIAGFNPGYMPPLRYILDIPGTPRLISRGKKGLLNSMIDHFGIVFATGPNGTPLPDDLTFELQADTNHEHTPFPYVEFCNGGQPVFYSVRIDSKAKVIERLEKFFRNPKKYRPFIYNCEDFAREIMSGVPECQQLDRAMETAKESVKRRSKVTCCHCHTHGSWSGDA